MCQLRHVLSLCEAAFAQPKRAISPSIKLMGRLHITPPAAPAAGAAAAGGAALLAVAAPMAARGAPLELHTLIVCSAPSPAAGASKAQQLLALRLLPAARAADSDGGEVDGRQPSGSGSSAFPRVEACVLQLPEGCSAVDAAVYKGEQVAVLLQREGEGEGGRLWLPLRVFLEGRGLGCACRCAVLAVAPVL